MTYSFAIQDAVNTIENQNVFIAEQLKKQTFSEKISALVKLVIESEGSYFKALEWIYLREKHYAQLKLLRYESTEVDKAIEHISLFVKPNKSKGWENYSKELGLYYRLKGLCDIPSYFNVEVLLQAVQETYIDQDVILWSTHLGSGNYYWGANSRIYDQRMSDYEVAAIMRYVAKIEKEKREETIKKTKPYIKKYFMGYGRFTDDMDGYVIIALLQAVYEGCEDHEIRDAIVKVQSLKDLSGKTRFLMGMLAIPQEERPALVEEIQKLGSSFFIPDEVNVILLFYLLPSHLRILERIRYSAFPRSEIQSPEYKEVLITSLQQKIDQGITPWAQIQFIEFIKILELDENHPLMSWTKGPKVQIKERTKEVVAVAEATVTMEKKQTISNSSIAEKKEIAEEIKITMTSIVTTEKKETISNTPVPTENHKVVKKMLNKKFDVKEIHELTEVPLEEIGMLKGKLEVAKKMLEKKYELKEICELTDLSPEDFS